MSSVQSLAVGEGIIGIAFQEIQIVNDSLQFMLRFSVSTDSGQTFSPSIQVDDDSDLSSVTAPQSPSLVWKGGVFYVAWRDPVTNDRISFSYSSNSGQSFVSSTNVNPFNSAHLFPSLAVNDSGKAFVAWLDDRRDPIFSENYHTFVARGLPRAVKGDLNLDSILTVVDAVMELNAVFLGQSFPAPLQNADVNCDGKLTAADAVLELNAVFLGNPFPCAQQPATIDCLA